MPNSNPHDLPPLVPLCSPPTCWWRTAGESRWDASTAASCCEQAAQWGRLQPCLGHAPSSDLCPGPQSSAGDRSQPEPAHGERQCGVQVLQPGSHEPGGLMQWDDTCIVGRQTGRQTDSPTGERKKDKKRRKKVRRGLCLACCLPEHSLERLQGHRRCTSEPPPALLRPPAEVAGARGHARRAAGPSRRRVLLRCRVVGGKSPPTQPSSVSLCLRAWRPAGSGCCWLHRQELRVRLIFLALWPATRCRS